jgi:CHAT domain-containing protein/tetratricopeptide (TPR) repeat protein
LLFSLGLIGCRSTPARAAQKTYEDAWIKLKRGELGAALIETDGALKLFPANGDLWHWRFTVLKAEILVRQRSSNEALALLAPELPSNFDTSDVAVWRKMTQGTAHAFLREFNEAERLFAEAETLAKRNHPALAGEVFLRKGTLAFLRGDWRGAEAEYHRALAASLAQNDGFLEAAARGSLGLIATRQEHYDESIDWDSTALQLSRTLGAQTSAARTLGNLGWSYFELGDYEESLSLFQQAQETFARTGATGSQIKWLTNVGITHYYLREYDLAEKETQQALQLARNLGEKAAITECMNSLSAIALAKGQIELAEKDNLEAHQAARAAGDHDGEIWATLISGRIQLAQRKHAQAEQSFEKVISERKVESAVHWEAEARLGKVYDEEGQTVKAEKEYKRAIQTIQEARHSVGQDELRLTFLSSAIDFYDDYIHFLMQHGRVEDALWVADLTRSQTLVEGLASANKAFPTARSLEVPPRQLAQKLHATLLLYWVGQEHSYLWVVTPSKLSFFPLPKKSEIDPAVKAYRQDVSSGRDVLASDSAGGKQLYGMLVAPARHLIPKNSRVILLPAETLYGLNFETLIVSEPEPHFWIEDVILSTASSLALLSTPNQKPLTKERSLLLVGNPEPANADFPLLAQAPAEMQKISGHFPQTKREVLEGRKATPAAYLKSDPGRFAYLHFVTHGTASHTRPLESAVILTRDGDSYKLYAREIVKHSLTARLVTISACNGAGARAYAGEGLIGLSWAFLRAGARNVIASLWEVSDASSTPQLMDALYEGLDKGEDPATALRSAKLSLLKANSRTVFGKPFYWAPFQLYTGS